MRLIWGLVVVGVVLICGGGLLLPGTLGSILAALGLACEIAAKVLFPGGES